MTQLHTPLKGFARLFFLIACLFSIHAKALEGGQLASVNQSTGIVGISYEGGFQNCIGVLLEPTKVLTAASCTFSSSVPVAASAIRVHPLIGTEIGGTVLLPTLNEDVTPFVGVSSYQRHPLNPFSSGPYNLAILTLTEPLDIGFVKLYGGDQSFVGQRGLAFGWENITRQGSVLLERFYQANVLQLPPIVDGDSEFDSITNGCYDSFVDTDTVFCAGFRNETQFLESDDDGAPMYANIAGQSVVIGLLTFASSGISIDGVVSFEEYSRVSSMQDFIKLQAPNAIFVADDVIVNPPGSSPIITPILPLLLDDQVFHSVPSGQGGGKQEKRGDVLVFFV